MSAAKTPLEGLNAKLAEQYKKAGGTPYSL